MDDRAALEGALRELVSAAAVRDVLLTYAAAVDDRDYDRLRGCFDPAVEAEHGGVRTVGVDAIVAIVRGLDSFATTTHIVQSAQVRVEGRVARSVALCTACLVSSTGAGTTATVRGIRYDDVLEDRDGRWVIVRRRHRPLWQYDVPAIASPGLPQPLLDSLAAYRGAGPRE
ncbi:nuclear transport factor 2 family protein [Dactylosporangium sp. NPDC051485]|uniref:nuclear transport factor 2 family protein n=1 Tax=Dactylosporangium sp. NPDC051485 TaxID=3154846 RepID=UPI00342B3B41